MTTCPSGVNYMHLVDHGRARIEKITSGRWPTGRCARCWRWCCRGPGCFARRGFMLRDDPELRGEGGAIVSALARDVTEAHERARAAAHVNPTG
jgi:hypothetical protein